MNELTCDNASIDSLNGDVEVEDLTMICEDNTPYMDHEENILRNKRNRDKRDDNSSEEGWNTVRRVRKIIKKSVGRTETQIMSDEKIQVCVSSKNPLPKQFALARLFKENNILHTSQVKYVHKHRMHITFDKESSADIFLQCKAFSDLEWRSRKTSEVSISYGLIKDVDLDITDDEMMKNISCDYEILSVKRLDRRCDKADSPGSNGWVASETVRLGFKGASLPSYVYIFDMRIKVEPFIFPVTQCSRCWKFGHNVKMCPSKKIVCPKCTENHENCNTTSFSCVNCKGPHMALQKICPIYAKERRIRELMAEFNCTYRKALTLYVPPESPVAVPISTWVTEKNKDPIIEASSEHVSALNLLQKFPENHNLPVNQVAQELYSSSNLEDSYRIKALGRANAKSKLKKIHRPSTPAFNASKDVASSSDEVEDPPVPDQATMNAPPFRCSKQVSFTQLLVKIKNIVMSNQSLENKIQQVVVTFTDWLITKLLNNVSAGSLFNLFVNNG